MISCPVKQTPAIFTLILIMIFQSAILSANIGGGVESVTKTKINERENAEKFYILGTNYSKSGRHKGNVNLSV